MPRSPSYPPVTPVPLGPGGGGSFDPAPSRKIQISDVEGLSAALLSKVDKVVGKVLSSNDFTNYLKNLVQASVRSVNGVTTDTGAVRIPGLFRGSANPVQTVGFIDGDQWYNTTTRHLWHFVSGSWSEQSAGAETVAWDDISNKPFAGQTVSLATDYDKLAALGTVIEKLGGTVHA